jgi:hypothetical protein
MQEENESMMMRAKVDDDDDSDQTLDSSSSSSSSSSPLSSSSSKSNDDLSSVAGAFLNEPAQQRAPQQLKQDKYVFKAVFPNGHVFRQFSDFVKRVTKDVTFSVSKYGLCTVFTGCARQIVSSAAFRRQDFIYFEYSDADNAAAVDQAHDTCHVFTIDSNELCDAVKGVGRRDSVCLWQTCDTNRLSVHIGRLDKESEFCTFVRNDDVVLKNNSKPKIVNIKTFVQKLASARSEPLRPPVCLTAAAASQDVNNDCYTISASRFGYAMSKLIKTRYHRIKLRVTSGGDVELRGGFTTAAAAACEESRHPVENTIRLCLQSPPPPCQDDTASIVSEIIFTTSAITALVKIVHLDTNGIIRIYGLSKNRILLEVPIGCYGRACIFISNTNTGTNSSPPIVVAVSSSQQNIENTPPPPSSSLPPKPQKKVLLHSVGGQSSKTTAGKNGNNHTASARQNSIKDRFKRVLTTDDE